MLRRTFSTIALLTLLFCTVYFGGIIGIISLATIVTTLALFEYYRLAEHFGAFPRKTLGIIVSLLFIPSSFYITASKQFSSGMQNCFLLIAGGILLYAIYLLKKQEIPKLHKHLVTTSGILYLPFMISFFALLIGEYGKNGILLCLWILLSTKFTDVGGLIFGCSLGKHKLAPNISPNKTWEGVFGGIALSMLVGAATIWAFNSFGLWETSPENSAFTPLPENFKFSPLIAALAAIPLAATSVISDLAESVIKRRAGDKDSGHTIPGMGGALDLLDSLVLVAPVGYALTQFILLA